MEEERRRAIKAEVKTAVERWYVQCFHFLPFRDVKEVIARLEEYALMCEVMKTARREFGGEIYIEEEVRRAFWWDGEWEGREISCFVTSHKALCRVGDAVWKFAVWSTPEGVYIKPDSHLYSQWTRVAARGGE